MIVCQSGDALLSRTRRKREVCKALLCKPHRFSGTIVADYQRQRLVELDHRCIVWAEAPDTLD